MSRNPSSRAVISRPLLITGIGLTLLIAALLAILSYQSASYTPNSLGAAQLGAPGGGRTASGDASGGSGRPAPAPPPGADGMLGTGTVDEAGTLTADDGLVPDGVTLFDAEYPAVSKLDPHLLAALRDAAADAERSGVTLIVNSGWRSARYQEELLAEAIAQYGSATEAARWVATPQTSPHVSGEAVDLGPSAGASWLARHGADYGLCLVYRNEPWHFELRPDAIGGRCPAPYADPTQDPRMQQG